MNHLPSDILIKLWTTQGRVSYPSQSVSWPAYSSMMPHTPDEAIAVINTVGRVQGRIQRTGETIEKQGLQIMLRTHVVSAGWLKMQELSKALDDIKRQPVAIETCNYMIHGIHKTTHIIHVGQDDQTREIFTLNAIATIKSQG